MGNNPPKRNDMAALLHNQFELMQTVYLTTDADQRPRIVTAIILRPGATLYELSSGTTCTCHYEFEVASEIDVLKTSTN